MRTDATITTPGAPRFFGAAAVAPGATKGVAALPLDRRGQVSGPAARLCRAVPLADDNLPRACVQLVRLPPVHKLGVNDP